MRTGLLSLLLTTQLLLVVPYPLAAQQPSAAKESAKLRSFLRDYLHSSYVAGDNTTRYFAAFVDLQDGRTQEVIVYFTDPNSCGTGGCTTLILAPEGSSYAVITSITIGWPPIRVLSSRTNGWHDLGIWVQGGGIQPGYEATLQFDGKTYPRNPSVPPAKRLAEKATGKIIIPKSPVGAPLY